MTIYDPAQDFPRGRANRAFPIASPLFNYTARDWLSHKLEKPFRIASAVREFMCKETAVPPPAERRKDGASIQLVADFQMRTAFRDMVSFKVPERLWALKMKITPQVTSIYPALSNGKPRLSLVTSRLDACTYLVAENLDKATVMNMMRRWNSAELSAEAVIGMFGEVQNLSRNLESDRNNASQLIAEYGPMVPAGDRGARYDQAELNELYREKLLYLEKEAKVEERLAKYTKAETSEIVPGEKGLFARMTIPKGTYLGDYMGTVYDPGIHDSTTHVFMPRDPSFSVSERYKKAIFGMNALRYANDAPDTDISDWAGRSVKAANMYVDGTSFYAACDIPEGTELTWNYQGENWKAYDDPSRRELSLARRRPPVEASTLANPGDGPA